jgi:hypothetical protein
MKTLKSNSLTALLDAKHVSYEMIPHRHTETAAAEARAIRVDPDQVAKRWSSSRTAGLYEPSSQRTSASTSRR